jgi:DNA-binding IclR family transcriptional regulator
VSLVSRTLRDFLERSIDNYEQVEVLVLMSAEARPITARELAETLHMEERSAANALEHLWRLGVIAPVTGGYHCVPGEHTATVGELARLHRDNRQAVVGLLAELALDRLRVGNIRAFADAFKWRGKKDG